MSSNYYTVLYTPLNHNMGEKICTAILFTNGKEAFFKYSRRKLNLVKQLVSANGFELLQSNLRSIQSFFLERQYKTLQEPTTTYGENTRKLQFGYLQYLSKYSNNLLAFSEPTKIDIELNSENFNRLFEKYVCKKKVAHPTNLTNGIYPNSSNSNFFTNKDGNTLTNKFKGIFANREIEYFDALVGYFRASGYFKIRPFLEDVEYIRILVGIDVDEITAIYANRGAEIKFTKEHANKLFFNSLVKEDIRKAQYSKKVENGIIQFVEDVKRGKVRLKAHPRQNIHAKFYVFREQVFNVHNTGEVITGSSNLTASGLEQNFEFNVKLNRYEDVAFALNTFEELWKESNEIEAATVAEIPKKTYLNDQFTPQQIYYKFLLEHFGESVNYDPDGIDLPEGFKKLSYQIDAVNDGYRKMLKYNGFFLADVVGLGKTVIAVMIARKFYFQNGFHTKTLIICPPATYDNWKRTSRLFRLHNYDIITNGSLHKIKHAEEYDLIIVDEVHKFRSVTSIGFNELEKLCKTPCKYTGQIITANNRHKKVMLLSATLFNNRPEDIRNLVYLFQDARVSSLEIGNVQSFFAKQIEQWKKAKEANTQAQLRNIIRNVGQDIRQHIIEPLTVRRTRTDLKENELYATDLKKQQIVFPDVDRPIPIYYELDDDLNKLYDATMSLLIDEDQKGLKYARYQALKYLKADKRKAYPKADMIAKQLANIMKTLLVKRLDSSFKAFKESLRNFQKGNRAMIKMFENDLIYIAPELDMTQLILDDKEEELEKLFQKKAATNTTFNKFDTSDFLQTYLPLLHKDQEIYDDLVNRWAEITYDPKLDRFFDYLEKEFIKKSIEKKIVIFSESKVTTDYLEEKMKEKNYDKVITVSGSNRNKKTLGILKENFDANYDGKHKNDYNIVISTEVLAEGINLHRANVIVNYDTPWNATRLMQRIGRVNRIGSKAKKVYVYNFYPTEKVESDIELQKKAYMKLQTFHTALGEDSQIYSDAEEYESFGLFDQQIQEEKDKRLELLLELRAFKSDFPEAFKQIEKLPLKARVGRKNAHQKGSTIAYLKNSYHDSFYYLKADDTYEELSFLQAAAIFKPIDEKEKAFRLHELHHEQVLKAKKIFEKEEETKIIQTKIATQKLSPTAKKAIGFLKMPVWKNVATTSQQQELKWAIEMIKIGRFQQLPNKINQISPKKGRKPAINVMLEQALEVIQSFPKEDRHDNQYSHKERHFKRMPNIIISESFDW